MRRRAGDDGKRGHAEAQRIAGDARRALVAGFDRDRAIGRVGQHPFDGDRARAGPDVPQKLAAPRRERRERDCANVALGDLAVVLERVVRQAGSARQHARVAVGGDFERDGVERGDVVEREALRLRRADALARAAHRLADRQHGPAHAARREQRRELGRRRVVPGERQDSGAGLKMRNDRLQRPAMQREERAILLAPAEPRGGEREGRGRGDSDHFGGREAAHQQRARRRKRTDRRWRARRPACRARPRSGRAHPRSATARRNVSAASGPASARCRRPPTTKAACARRRRAAGESPSIPSSPRPTTASQRLAHPMPLVAGAVP